MRRKLIGHVAPFAAGGPNTGGFSTRGACRGVVAQFGFNGLGRGKLCVSRAAVHVYCARHHLLTRATLRLVTSNGGRGTVGVLGGTSIRVPTCGIALSCVDNNLSVTHN